MIDSHPYGFRIVGDCRQERRLINWAAAFVAHCACDDRANVVSEVYLSAFTFGDDFRKLLDDTGSTRGYAGPCWSPWLWFDIDAGDNVQRALDDARRLAGAVVSRYALDDNSLLIFYSGAKGFHVGVPSSLWSPLGSTTYHRATRRLAERLATLAGVTIDVGVYDAVRAFRAPNSRHPKTGLHKRRLSLDELLRLSLDGIRRLAATPVAFDVPAPRAPSTVAVDDWRAAVESVDAERQARQERRAEGTGTPRLNRQTLDFIRDGAPAGDRHRLLFSAAANLAEFGCPMALAHALLAEPALDAGLPPRDVTRQIDCGLAQGGTDP